MTDPYGVTDLTVTTVNPTLLDETIQQLPMCEAVVVDDSFNGTTCVVRVFSGLGFLKFALKNQGYGNVVNEESVTVPTLDEPEWKTDHDPARDDDEPDKGGQ